MHVYRILCPTTSIADGLAHDTFRAFVFDVAGGFTQHPAATRGWINPEGEGVYDAMVPYDVACPKPVWAIIKREACKLWPTEEKLFAVEGGEAVLFNAVSFETGSRATLRRYDDAAWAIERVGHAAHKNGESTIAHKRAASLGQRVWAVDTAGYEVRVARSPAERVRAEETLKLAERALDAYMIDLGE